MRVPHLRYARKVRGQPEPQIELDLDPHLPVEPFRAWLEYQVGANSIGGVARNTGVTARRIKTLLDGYYYKKGKRYEVKRVQLSVVDTWMTSFGEHYQTLYPEVDDGLG